MKYTEWYFASSLHTSASAIRIDLVTSTQTSAYHSLAGRDCGKEEEESRKAREEEREIGLCHIQYWQVPRDLDMPKNRADTHQPSPPPNKKGRNRKIARSFVNFPHCCEVAIRENREKKKGVYNVVNLWCLACPASIYHHNPIHPSSRVSRGIGVIDRLESTTIV